MKNKNVLTMMALLVIILVLSACGDSAEVASSLPVEETSSNGADPGADDTRAIGEEFRDAIPVSAQLGFGTLMLEESEYAVDPEQAAQLLPLWKAARSLSESDTVAEKELDAVFTQIEDTMTSEQISAINEMQLTGEEMAQLMEDLEISLGFGVGTFGNRTPEQQATAQAARESGEGLPGGGIPGGGNPGGRGPGGGQGLDIGNLTPEQQATMEARREERGGAGARFALVFADPLIELLEQRAAE